MMNNFRICNLYIASWKDIHASFHFVQPCGCFMIGHQEVLLLHVVQENFDSVSFDFRPFEHKPQVNNTVTYETHWSAQFSRAE